MEKFPFNIGDRIHVSQDTDMLYIRKDSSPLGYHINTNSLEGLKDYISNHPKDLIELGKDYLKIKRIWL